MIVTASPSAGQETDPPPAVPPEPPKITKIQNLMDERLPGKEAGIMLTEDERIVIRVKREAAEQAQAEVSQRGLAENVEFRPVEHSRAELAELARQIFYDPDAPESLVGTSPDMTTNTVFLHLNDPDPVSAGAPLVSKYGASWVTVDPERAELGQRAYRYNDTAPFYGGDAIWRRGHPVQLECSSGFATRGNNTGNEYMLTAGHCWPGQAGAAWIDTNYDSPRNMGLLTNIRFCDGCIDSATISGDYAGRVWATPDRPTVGVVGVAKLHENQGQYSLVTVSGARTGEHRGLTVVGNDACRTFPDGIQTCYLTRVSGHLVQGGDSGGPAYQYAASGPNVWATGTIVGYHSGETVYQQIHDITNYFNLTVQTVPYQ